MEKLNKDKLRKITAYTSLNKNYIPDYNKIDTSEIYSIFTTSDYNEIMKIIKNNSLFNIRDDDGSTLVHAIIENSTNITEDQKKNIIIELMNKNISISVMNKYNQNPLHYAAKNGYYTIFKFLINNNANYKLIDNNGNSPLHYMIDNLIIDCNKNDMFNPENYKKNISHSTVHNKINNVISKAIINDIFIKTNIENLDEIKNLIELIKNNKFFKKSEIIEIFKNTENELNKLTIKNNFIDKNLYNKKLEIYNKVKNNLVNEIYSNLNFDVDNSNVFDDKFDNKLIDFNIKKIRDDVKIALNTNYNNIYSNIETIEEKLKIIYKEYYEVPFNFISEFYYKKELSKFKYFKISDKEYFNNKLTFITQDHFKDKTEYNIFVYNQNRKLINTLNIDECNIIDTNNNIVRPFILNDIVQDYFSSRIEKDQDQYIKTVKELEFKLKEEVPIKLEKINTNSQTYDIISDIKIFETFIFIDSYLYIYLNSYLYNLFKYIGDIKISFLSIYLNSNNPTDFTKIKNITDLDTKIIKLFEIFINFINRSFDNKYQEEITKLEKKYTKIIPEKKLEIESEIKKIMSKIYQEEEFNKLLEINKKIKSENIQKPEIISSFYEIIEIIKNIETSIPENNKKIYYQFKQIFYFYLIINLNIILFQVKNNIKPDINTDVNIINKNIKNTILPLIDEYKKNIKSFNKILFLKSQDLFLFDDSKFDKYDNLSYINMLIIKNICIDNFISLHIDKINTTSTIWTYLLSFIQDKNKDINKDKIEKIDDENKFYDIISYNFEKYSGLLFTGRFLTKQKNEFNTKVNSIQNFKSQGDITIDLLADLILYATNPNSVDYSRDLLNYSSKFLINNNNTIFTNINQKLAVNPNIFAVILSFLYNSLINVNNTEFIDIRQQYINILKNIPNFNYNIKLNKDIKDQLIKSISFIVYGNNPVDAEVAKIQNFSLQLDLLKTNNPNINGGRAIPYEHFIMVLTGIILNQVDDNIINNSFVDIDPILKLDVKDALYSIFGVNPLNQLYTFNIRLQSILRNNNNIRRNEYNKSDFKLNLSISFIKSSINQEIINNFLVNDLETEIYDEIRNLYIYLSNIYKDIDFTKIIPANIEQLINEKKEESNNEARDISNKNIDYSRSAETLKNNLKDMLKINYIDKSLPISDIYYDINSIIIQPVDPNDNPEVSPCRNAATAIRKYTYQIPNPPYLLTPPQQVINAIINHDNIATKAADNINVPNIDNKNVESKDLMISHLFNGPIPAAPPPAVQAWNNAHIKAQSAATSVDNEITFIKTYLNKAKDDAIAIIPVAPAPVPPDDVIISSELSNIALITANKVIESNLVNGQIIPVASAPAGAAAPPAIAAANKIAIDTININISTRISYIKKSASPAIASAAINVALAAAVAAIAAAPPAPPAVAAAPPAAAAAADVAAAAVAAALIPPGAGAGPGPFVNINNFRNYVAAAPPAPGPIFGNIDNIYKQIMINLSMVPIQRVAGPVAGVAGLGGAAVIINKINIAVQNIPDENLIDIVSAYIRMIAAIVPIEYTNSIYAAATNAAILIANNSEKALLAIPSGNTRSKEVTNEFVKKTRITTFGIINNLVQAMNIRRDPGDIFINKTINSIESKLDFIVKQNMDIIDKYYLLPIDKSNKNDSKNKNNLSEKFINFTTTYLDKINEIKKAENKADIAKKLYESYINMLILSENRLNKFIIFNKLLCETELLYHEIINRELIQQSVNNEKIKTGRIIMGGGRFYDAGGDGNCFYYSLYEALENKKIKLGFLKYNNKEEFNIQLRNYLSQNINLNNLINVICNDKLTDINIFNQKILGFSNEIQNLFRNMDCKNHTKIIQDYKNIIKQDKIWISEPEVTAIKQILKDNNIILRIVNNGINPVNLQANEIMLRNDSEMHYVWYNPDDSISLEPIEKSVINKNIESDNNNNFKIYSMYISEYSFRKEFIPTKIYINTEIHSYIIYILRCISTFKGLFKKPIDLLETASINHSFIIYNCIYEGLLNIINNLSLFYKYLININTYSIYVNIVDDQNNRIINDNKEINENLNNEINIKKYFDDINSSKYKQNFEDIYNLITDKILNGLNNLVNENNKIQSLIHYLPLTQSDYYSNNINFSNFYKDIPKTLNDYSIDFNKDNFIYKNYLPYYYCYDINTIYYSNNTNNKQLYFIDINNNKIIINSKKIKYVEYKKDKNKNNEYKNGYQQFLYNDKILYQHILDEKVNNYYDCNKIKYNIDVDVVIKNVTNAPNILINSLYIFNILIEKYILEIYNKYNGNFNVTFLENLIKDKKIKLNEKEKELFTETIEKIKNNKIARKNLIYENIIKLIKSYIEGIKNDEINILLNILFQDEKIKIINNLINFNIEKILSENSILDIIIFGNIDNKFKNNRIIDKCYKINKLDDFIKLKEEKNLDLKIKDLNGNTILNRLVDQYNLSGFKIILVAFPSLWTYKNNNNNDCNEYINNIINIIKQRYVKTELDSKFIEYGQILENIINNDTYQYMSFDNTEYELTKKLISKCINQFSNYIFEKCPELNKLSTDKNTFIEYLFNIDFNDDSKNNYSNLFNIEIEPIFNDYNDLDKYEDSSYNLTNYKIIEILQKEILLEIADEMKNLININFSYQLEVNWIYEILNISMITKLNLLNPDTMPQDIESYENKLIDSVIKNNDKNEAEVEKLELREIIKFYKIISDDICLHGYDELKNILIDLKKISILLQMKSNIKV